jgi:RNA polymerase sigma-70 factor (ECF subfamily)
LTEAFFIEQVHQPLRMEWDDSAVVSRLAKRDEKTFEQIFKIHFKNLHGYAFTIIKDEVASEEMVQNVFFKLWERTENLSLTGSVAAYLYRSVHNECLNYLKHQSVKSAHQMHVAYTTKNEIGTASKNFSLKELEGKLQAALNELPEQCRTIFQLSRFEELRYKEIAVALGISVKTVENQMGKALKILRMKLVDFLPLIIFLFTILKSSH